MPVDDAVYLALAEHQKVGVVTAERALHAAGAPKCRRLQWVEDSP